MLCERCSASRARRGARAVPAAPDCPAGERSLAGVVCASCGALLPQDATDVLLETLAQLARFGLVPEGQPLFESVRARS